MKLQCPHCGVKGSAEDSYSGRKVKCPKCQGLFELKTEMALELPEDSTLVSEPPAAPADSPAPSGEVETPISDDKGFGETAVDEDIAVEEFERSVEFNGEPTETEIESTPLLNEETLDLEDTASEIDLQLDEGELAEKSEKTLQGDPVESSALEDEFAATPAGDFGLTVEEESGIEDVSGEDILDEVEENPAESEVAEFMEESSLLDPVDSSSLEQEKETENDLDETAVIAENNEPEESADEVVQLVEDDDEIEPEPHAIDKEQCWQCGKQDSVGESFVAKDGQLYCTDCAPVGEPEEALGTNLNQGEGETLDAQELSADSSGLSDDAINESDNQFGIGGGIRKAWAKIKTIWS